MNKKLIFLILTVFLFISCNEKPNQNRADSSTLFGVIEPINLTPKADTIYLEDLMKDPAEVDSFSFHDAIEYKLDENKNEIYLKLNDQDLPLLSIMKIWFGDKPESILLRKSRKKSFVFSFDPGKKNYEKVQLAGSFNNWSPEKTTLERNDGIWKTKLYLNPGNYQYQVVTDGEWMLDPTNPEKASNNIGGFNSVLKIKGHEWEKKPVLLSHKFEKGSLILKQEEETEKVFAFWQNQLIEPEKNGDQIKIHIPEKANKLKRSHIRVYAYNKNGLSNDLFVPLEKGKVIQEPGKLTRNDKRTTIMYFMMVDRFNNGNPENDDPLENPDVHPKANYHGGDLAGITQKIQENYFQNLGFNTLWISPITQNPTRAYREYPKPHRLYSGYHGYWPVTLTTVDYRFGSSEELNSLVQKAHKQEMNVILDFVSNHVHKENKLYQEHPDWATEMILPSGDTNIRIWDEQRLTTWFDTFLPTLDLRKQQVVELMSDSALFWLDEYKLDGFRHDATKHIPTNYWRTLTRKINHKIPDSENVLQIGETFGSRELIGNYVGPGKLDGQFDFNLYFDARYVFASNEGSFKTLEKSLKETFSYYGWHSLMGNITGNHDIPRFISFAGGALKFNEDAKAAGWERKIAVEDPVGYDKLSSLTAFIMTIPGIPVVYYGDEFGMPGAGDPDNRRDMRFEGLSENEQKTKQITKKLINLRNKNLELIYGDFIFLKSTDNVLVYARKYLDKVSIIAFNKGTESKNIKIELPGILKDFEYNNNFNSEWSIDKDNNLKLTLKKHTFEILNN